MITHKSCAQVNEDFNKIKDDGFEENNEYVDPLTLVGRLGLGTFLQKKVTVNYDAQAQQNEAPTDAFNEHCLRYFHERNKICTMFLAVKCLRLLMKEPLLEQLLGLIYPLALGLAKKGKI